MKNIIGYVAITPNVFVPLYEAQPGPGTNEFLRRMGCSGDVVVDAPPSTEARLPYETLYERDMRVQAERFARKLGGEDGGSVGLDDQMRLRYRQPLSNAAQAGKDELIDTVPMHTDMRAGAVFHKQLPPDPRKVAERCIDTDVAEDEARETESLAHRIEQAQRRIDMIRESVLPMMEKRIDDYGAADAAGRARIREMIEGPGRNYGGRPITDVLQEFRKRISELEGRAAGVLVRLEGRINNLDAHTAGQHVSMRKEAESDRIEMRELQQRFENLVKATMGEGYAYPAVPLFETVRQLQVDFLALTADGFGKHSVADRLRKHDEQIAAARNETQTAVANLQARTEKRFARVTRALIGDGGTLTGLAPLHTRIDVLQAAFAEAHSNLSQVLAGHDQALTRMQPIIERAVGQLGNIVKLLTPSMDDAQPSPVIVPADPPAAGPLGTDWQADARGEIEG